MPTLQKPIPLKKHWSAVEMKQFFLKTLADEAKLSLTPLELCQLAGYTTHNRWYDAMLDADFREAAQKLGVKCLPYHPYEKDPAGMIPLATDLDAEWAHDRIDVRRLTSEYPKHKRSGMYKLDFTSILNPALRALIKRYFRARVGYWSGCTFVTTLSTFKPILQELERRYPGIESFASLTREMIEPVLAMPVWTDHMQRTHPFTLERKLRTVILVGAMFSYMQQHHWEGAPQCVLLYDEDKPKRPRHKPRPLPASVLEQILQNLDKLPPYARHLIQIMSVMGLRAVDALHLTEDCVEYDGTGDPRVRWYNMKMKRDVRPLPVTDEVVAAIKAQRELVKDFPPVFGKRYLFRTRDGLYAYERLRHQLKLFARDVPILGLDGQIYTIRPHQFRHTVGTQMINNGMGIADVMVYLDHDSAEMTLNYAQIEDATLKRKFKELVTSGRAVGGLAVEALQQQIAQGDESELDWVVSNLRRLSLPWGYCLHHAKATKCPYGQNVCFTKDNGPCHKLVTTSAHASVIQATMEDLNRSKQKAEAQGWEMYATDLNDQIQGMTQVLTELAAPEEQRLLNRGGPNKAIPISLIRRIKPEKQNE